MSRPVIVVHGNCVASYLIDVLESLPGAGDAFEIAGFAFGRPAVEDSILERAELLVTQNRVLSLELPLPEVVKKLPTGIPSLRMPNVMLQSLWPLNCPDPRDGDENPFGPYRRSQTDRLALDIMRRVSDPAARRDAYFAVSISSMMDLGRLHEIQAEQMVQGEQDCDIQIAAHVLTSFRKTRLFFARHHPTPALLMHLAAQIVTHARFAPFRRGSAAAALSAMHAFIDAHKPFAGEEVPIHPEVARFFELEWWAPDMLYDLDDRRITFEQWLEAYMAEPLP